MTFFKHDLSGAIFIFLLASQAGMHSYSQTTTANNKIDKVQLLRFTSKGELKITASEASSKNDFDFLTGSHKVHHKMLKSRLNNCKEWIEFDGTQEMSQILTGTGNIDKYNMTTPDGKPIEGMALRLFNPETRLWSIYWADSHTGTLDIPVVGSFENKTGYFFAKDKFNGKDILLQFKWDISNPDEPVWSQAFSPDNGKTWEWNWYMYFRKEGAVSGSSSPGEISNANNALAAGQPVKVLELRNYVTKPGHRDKFVDFFENNFTDAQSAKGGYIVGMFRVKGAENNFFWMRGFRDMSSRSKYLPGFYFSDYWKQRRNTANSMLVNNDNVYLLKPLLFSDESKDSAINSNEFGKAKGLVVVDYYIANTRLKELIAFFKEKYVSFLRNNGIKDFTLWVSELQENDFPALPVFQDKNLLVVITSYKDEKEYNNKMSELNADKNKTLVNELMEIMTTKHTLLLYPTGKSFIINENETKRKS